MSENIYIILAILIAIFGVAYGVTSGNIKTWLRYGVFLAEQELGSGTGQLKLVKVYNMFVEKYPVISKILPFVIFSGWVDLALEWLRLQLESNKNVEQIVNN